jgi:hypothetical protein
MGNPSVQEGPSAYLESLMQVGQQATEQGVENKPAKGEEKSPFAVTAGLQQQYRSPILDFWPDFFDDKPARGEDALARAPRGDRRFKEAATPFGDVFLDVDQTSDLTTVLL